jgi:DNA-binding PadR family transcriptional regulator
MFASMKKTSLEPPLSNAVTYILLALAEHDLHGYGIMQGIVRLSDGEYKVGPGTLYDNLRTLLLGGLVDEFEEAATGDEVRRIYRLTKAGAAVLEDELARLNGLVKAGRSRLASGRTGVATDRMRTV